MTTPLHDFFRTVITSLPREPSPDGDIGYLCMAIRPKDRKEWHEHFLKYPSQIDEAVAFAEKMKGEFNVYFSSYLFSRPNSQKEFVLPSRTIWADLDGAKLDDCPIPPSVIVETSPGHHQGYWLLDNALVPDAHEVLSRRLTYAIRGADRTGWPSGHKMRVPDTFNYKRDTPALIHVVKLTDTKYETSRIEMFPDPPALVHTRDQEWINNEVTTPLIGPEELLASLANKLPASVIDNYHKPDPKDRSGKLWHLMLSCFRAGCTREEVWWLAKHSANNKFSVLRFNGERDLKRDVASAEQAAKAEALNIRGAIASTRKIKMTAAEKNRMICKIVLDDMQNYGEFVHATNGRKFYLLKEVGRPIPVVTKGTELSSLLSTKYGLNATEKEHAFVVAEIQANTQNMEKNWTSAALTFYNKDRNEVLLHTGRRDVLRITPEQITYVPNGAFGILFQWDAMTDSFAPNLNSTLDWGTKLFGPSMDNIVTYTRAQGMALLKVWFIFMLLRNQASSRPILSLFAAPGSGKSALFRRVYRLLYGTRKFLSAITTPDNFDQELLADPFVVFDNVDSSPGWLPDRLALSASPSDFVKRELYTDLDSIRVQRQAMIGLTAHNPRFGRADVIDRLLVLNFTRFEDSQFKDESEMVEAVTRQRNDMWGSIIQDVQKVLRVDPSLLSKSPRMRVQDFSTFGWRIAHGLGCVDDFAAALHVTVQDQTKFVLEEDSVLIAAIQSLLSRRSKKNGHLEHWQSITSLWVELEAVSGDPMVFRRTYSSAPVLGRHLMTTQHTLKNLFGIKWRLGQDGTREWAIETHAKELDMPKEIEVN